MRNGSELAKALALIIAVSLIPFAIGLLREGPIVSPPVADEIAIDQALKQPSEVIWIDSRPEALFDMRHIPHAINLNRDNWDRALPNFLSAYSPGETVIVYCSAGCFESTEIASKIRDLGLDPVLVLQGGFEAWLSRRSTS